MKIPHGIEYNTPENMEEPRTLKKQLTPEEEALRDTCLGSILLSLRNSSIKKTLPYVEVVTIDINAKTSYPPPKNDRTTLALRFPLIRDRFPAKEGDWEYFYLFCDPLFYDEWLSPDESRWWYAVGVYPTFLNHPDEHNPFSTAENVEIYNITAFLKKGFKKFLKRYKSTTILREGDKFLY